MKNIWVDIRRTPEQHQEARKLLRQLAEKNLLDEAVLGYASTSILRAFSDKTHVVLPVQSVYMLESLGISEDATPLEIAKSLAQLVQTVSYQARQDGKGETYMFCNDKQTEDFAKNHGFELMPYPCYRMRHKQ